MASNLHLAYRRNAQAAANNHKVRKHKDEDSLIRARDDFAFFCEYIDPKKKPAKHHLEWHQHLVTNQDSDCLLKIAGPNLDLLASRGSAKSTILGLLTAWAIGVHTTAKMPLQILYLSYTVDIARSKSATIKRIIESKRYQEVFPSVRLLKNVTSNEYWSIDYRFAGIENTGDEQFTLCAAGLKGSVTSKRSHLCLVGDTMVLTNRGQVPIASIYKNPEQYQIAVRNHITDAIDWCSVASVTKRDTKGVIQIETTNGGCIQATAEHPFITSEGRQERAGDLSTGQQLVELSSGYKNTLLPSMWSGKEKNTTYLFDLLQQSNNISSKTTLSSLRKSFFPDRFSTFPASFEESGTNTLQSPMCGKSSRCVSGESLSPMQQVIPTNISLGSVLLQDLCKSFALRPDEWRGKFTILSRMRSGELQETPPNNIGTRQFFLRGLWYQGEKTIVKQRYDAYKSLCSSHRSQQNNKYPAKFNHVMQAVPCSTSPDNGQSWAPVTISRITNFSDRKVKVYDLEVDHESHNFIANGFNVLNCLIDDPIKSSADISNPDIRRTMQDNWNAVIAPTMFEGGRAICLGTRFRHDDIHATTFNEQNNWRQIVLSAINNDPITGEEQSYWPEMWSLDYLKEKKRQAPVAFSFQYMNQIVRQNELSLTPELIVKAEIATEFDALGIGVDLSAGIKEKNDYTVMVLGGRIGDQIHIIDYRRLRVMGNLEKLDELKELLNDWSVIGKDEGGMYFPTYSTCAIWSEAVAYQASLESDFKRVCLNNEGLYNLNWHPVKAFRADKLARFRGIMGMFEDRKIIFNRYRNFTAMFEELTNFGVSSHDDCVDALVWLVTGLMRKGNLQIDF